MTDTETGRLAEIKARLPEVAASHARSNREALLEHARMGRPVAGWQDGQVVWVSPAEVFARYGLDENGKPATSFS